MGGRETRGNGHRKNGGVSRQTTMKQEQRIAPIGAVEKESERKAREAKKLRGLEEEEREEMRETPKTSRQRRGRDGQGTSMGTGG
ncbi:hypothetical protein niasHT_036109 [Heterodera trifolii]|uniref:Uncharacterized protein n=1 Tax=Heterodera trifolii TaxID=157864 RepID=A0ABD2I821_9BILA